MSDSPFVGSVFHPSDFSETSQTAFLHALAIVLYYQAGLTILHVVPEDEAADIWSDFPGVRETLTGWGLLDGDTDRGQMWDQLALNVQKVNLRRRDPLEAVLEGLDSFPADLVVLASEGRRGLPRWIKPSIAGAVARRTRSMTLFVRHGQAGFVSPADGSINLRRILVAIDDQADPSMAIARAASAAVMSHVDEVEMIAVRVGSTVTEPFPELPELHSCVWTKLRRKGDVVEQIHDVAVERDVDLIVLPTCETRGIFGALRGTLGEQMLQHSPVPVLAVPADPD